MTTTVLSAQTVPKYGWVFYTFIALELNKYIVYKFMYTAQKCIYTVYTINIYSTDPYVH